MPKSYSVQTIEQLTRRFDAAQLHRPMRVARYEPGTELVYDVTSVETADAATVRLAIEEFIGGGYAGQVYKIKVLEIVGAQSTIKGLQAGGLYAMKVLVPPTSFARFFRNTLYRLGFQGAFQPQVNPVAARAGALWQKFIRRAAKIRFGDESVVNNVHCTFVDDIIGSCGQISDWIDGRTWRLEVDDRMDILALWRKKLLPEHEKLGSPEYRAKRQFMAQFVNLLHDVGAHEFARQYEWSTAKSQPNCLKRIDTEGNPEAGLVAVDFMAGLTLLPFLPMSPGDFKLIWQGLQRGSLVQFDRGSVDQLEQFVHLCHEHFEDMAPMLKELTKCEQVYRDSLVDITHNHIRLLYSGELWSTIFDSAVTGWRVRNLVDEANENKLRASKFLTFIFCLLGAIPFLGKSLRRLWARPDWRTHYVSLLTSSDYLGRALRGRIAEKLIDWHRAGRVSPERAAQLADRPWRFFCHLPLALIPIAGLHRFLTDAAFFKEKMHYIFVRPVKLYFNSELREQWLRDMVEQGKKKHILTDQDADTILSQLGEPYIQRYLLSLVVHLLTLPVTQIVSVTVAWIYWRRTGDKLGAGGILVLFQITPISPGSICRGLWAVGIAIYDRSFRDYNIAVFLSFFKYIGYLGFPIQMTYRYPALARFMASHWATEAVHIVPVFGERGALLEHWVFCLFYNWPLTIRRRMAKRAQIRASLAPRYRHMVWLTALTAVVLIVADFLFPDRTAPLPKLGSVWWLSILAAGACGVGATLGAGGLALWKRIIAAIICGLSAGVFSGVISVAIAETAGPKEALSAGLWRAFALAVFSTIAAVITELKLPDPDISRLRNTGPEI